MPTTTALTVLPTETRSALTVSPEQLELIRTTIAKGATDEELKLFLYDNQRQGFHPLDKLLHFTKRGGKYTPIVSIDAMRMRAAETGEYVGNDSYEYAGTPGKAGFTAIARVWRLVQGQRVPFSRTARWEEYCPPAGQDHMWRQKPHVMLGKCAEAQALRAGFPRQLHGLYEDAEIPEPARPVEKPDARPVEKSRRESARPVENSDATLTPSQRKQLFATARTHGWTDEQLETYLEECGWSSSAEIPVNRFDELLQALAKGRQVGEVEG
jgi:phage recombination protein Bet